MTGRRRRRLRRGRRRRRGGGGRRRWLHPRGRARAERAAESDRSEDSRGSEVRVTPNRIVTINPAQLTAQESFLEYRLVIIANGMRLEVSRDQKVMVKKNGRNYSVGARSIRVGDEVVQIVGGMVVRGKVTAIGTAFGQMTMAAVETDKGNLEVNGFVCQAS